MAFATWWRGYPLPVLSPLSDFCAASTTNAGILAQLAHLSLAEVEQRLHQGHRPYVGWLEGQPVAYGWVATQQAHIGELDVTITLPPTERYLWDFATRPAWRGRGLYPRLLQAILRVEVTEAARFWIIAAPENRASTAGIAKAGFTSIAHLSFQRMGQPGLIAIDSDERIIAAAALLQVPVLHADPQQALAPCWHCAIDARSAGQAVADVACWPTPTVPVSPATTCHCA